MRELYNQDEVADIPCVAASRQDVETTFETPSSRRCSESALKSMYRNRSAVPSIRHRCPRFPFGPKYHRGHVHTRNGRRHVSLPIDEVAHSRVGFVNFRDTTSTSRCRLRPSGPAGWL